MVTIFRAQAWDYKYKLLRHNFTATVQQSLDRVERLVYGIPQQGWYNWSQEDLDRTYNRMCIEESRLHNLHVARESGVLS